jgi:hypothetical protein
VLARSSCRLVAAAALAHSTAAGQTSEAPLRTARLDYTLTARDQSCPDEAELRRGVGELLGYDPFRDEAPSRIVASVNSGRREFVARIVLHSATGESAGERELSAADCKELGSAVAFAIALAVDPMLPSRQRQREQEKAPPPPRPPPEPKPAVVARSLAEPPPPARPPPGEPWRLRLGTYGSLSFGSAPAPAVGAAALVGVRRGELSVSIEARRNLPAGDDAEPRGRVQASLSAASLVPCYHAGVLVACLLGTLGALQGEGEGVAEPRKDTSLHAAVEARAGLELPLASSIALAAFAGLGAPLTRTTLQVNDQDVWTTPALVSTLGLGILGDLGL